MESESEFDPLEPSLQTEPAGALEPPRRRPPTAVGTGKLPPRRPPRGEGAGESEAMPEDDGTPYPTGPTRLRRIALRLLAAYAAAGALALLWPLGWRAYAGATTLVSAHALWRRAVAERPAATPEAGVRPGDATARSRAQSA